MSRVKNRVWLSCLLLGATTALAQDIEVVDNPYALKKKPPKEEQAPLAPVDKALVTALGKRIEQCYQAEQGAPMNEADRQLLKSAGVEVARELSSALRFSSCDIDKPASPRCLQDLAAMECSTLADPIVSAGWDRNLTPAAKEKIAAYAEAIAQREAACVGMDAAERAIVSEIRADKLSILIEANIVIGQCMLRPDKHTECYAELAKMDCDDVAKLQNEGESHKLCSDLLVCTDTPDPGPDP